MNDKNVHERTFIPEKQDRSLVNVYEVIDGFCSLQLEAHEASLARTADTPCFSRPAGPRESGNGGVVRDRVRLYPVRFFHPAKEF